MYESNAQAVSASLTAASTEVFNAATIQQILSLVTTPTNSTISVDTVTAANNGTVAAASGVEVLFVNGSATAVTNVTVTGDAPVVFFQGAGGVNATIGAAAPATASGNASAAVVAGVEIARVVVGTAGADKITIADGKNTQVIAGDKDVITAGTGHTVVVAAQGDSTVIGNDKTIVQIAGVEADFTVTTDNGEALVTNTKTGVSVDLTGVNFVQLNGTDALIFADNVEEAAVANLYQALLGRTAEAGGLEFWYDRVQAGVSLEAIANGFLAAAEYTNDTQTNVQFIDSLYDGLLNRDGDTAGTAFWMAQLSAGTSRAEVAVNFTETVLAANVEIVGSVTIIDPIA